VRKLTGDLLGEENSFAAAQAQFAIAVAQAKAGNQAMADRLPDLASALVEAGRTRSVTSTEQDILTARTIGSLREVLSGIGTMFGVTVPAFASGGFHSGGLRLVGENGPELEVTGASRIYNASQTAAMLGGRNDKELIAEVRALREENSRLRMMMDERLAKIENSSARTAKATNGNPDMPILVEVAA